ncbi:MAG TPA: DUF1614 domain-containing protein, partial [Thermoplasmata archaeon]|nr:DUF1614 domain-containing protein [Thermoplasmata archaeon]
LPGALLGSLADIPFLPWAGNVLAINIGGALIPISLTLVLLHRELGPSRWRLPGLVVLILSVETATQFAMVLLTSSVWSEVLVLATAGGTVVGAVVVLPRWTARPAALRAVSFVALSSTAIVLTFLTSRALPGVGIVSAFPFYLIGPVVVGISAVWLASAVWGAPAYHGLGLGYGAATLGTLIGADVLREPPLYTGGGGALLAIGGAGILDLVYFSGLLAVGLGLLSIVLSSRGSLRELSMLNPPISSPEQSLRSAAGHLASGDPTGAIRDSISASRSAADRVRALWQSPAPAHPAAAWDGLPVAPYVTNDYRNLVESQRIPDPTPREAFRSLAMATQFVRLGRDLGRLRFAPTAPRGWAALVDLAVVTAPAVVLWTFLSLTLPGGVAGILVGLPFNLAVYAYVGYAMAYYVVGDVLFGVTVGKLLYHLVVTDRALARPTVLQSFLRESPKAVAVYAIGQFGAPALLILVRAGTTSLSAFGIGLIFTGVVLLGIVVTVVAVALGVGGLQVARDPERQRLGDRWASTWVLDRRRVTSALGTGPASPGVPPGAVPPG